MRHMRICVGDITARCEKCGSEDFQPQPGAASPAHEVFCFGCGTSTTRRALLMQIADRTMERAQAFLQQVKKQRSEPRKP